MNKILPISISKKGPFGQKPEQLSLAENQHEEWHC